MKTILAFLPLIFLAGCRARTPIPLPGEATSLPTTASKDGGIYRDFTRLTFQVTGGIAGIDETLKIEGDRISLSTTRPETNRVAPFSRAERETLAQILQRTDAMKLAGKYEQKELRDGFGETLTIVLKTKRETRIENFGDRAPAAYYTISSYLRELQARKFPAQ